MVLLPLGGADVQIVGRFLGPEPCLLAYSWSFFVWVVEFEFCATLSIQDRRP